MSDEYTLEVELSKVPRGWVVFAIGAAKPCIAPPPVSDEIRKLRQAVDWIIDDAAYKPPELVGDVAARWIHRLREARGLPCA